MLLTVIVQSYPVWTSYKLPTKNKSLHVLDESFLEGIKRLSLQSVLTFCLPELNRAFPCNSSLWLPETIMALGTGTEKRQTVFLCSQCSSCCAHSSEKELLGLEDTAPKSEWKVDGKTWQEKKDHQKTLLAVLDILMSRRGKCAKI